MLKLHTITYSKDEKKDMKTYHQIYSTNNKMMYELSDFGDFCVLAHFETEWKFIPLPSLYLVDYHS